MRSILKNKPMKFFNSISINKTVALIILVTLNLSHVTANAQPKPNIIFIMADDLGYADLGCYGQQKIETPNIDALARHGVKFMQFYSGTSVCAPARSTLFTGL